MPLVINTNTDPRSRIGGGSVSEQALENIRRMAKKHSKSRIHHESEGVNSQIREQVLSNQGAARRIMDGRAAQAGLILVRGEMEQNPTQAHSAQAGGNLIQISRNLLR